MLIVGRFWTFIGVDVERGAEVAPFLELLGRFQTVMQLSVLRPGRRLLPLLGARAPQPSHKSLLRPACELLYLRT